MQRRFSLYLVLIVIGALVASCGDSNDTSTLDDQDAAGDSTSPYDDVVGAGDVTKPEGDATELDAMTGDTGASSCQAGETKCIAGKVAVCDTEYGWLLEGCPEGTDCVDGACISLETCEPLTSRCEDGGVQFCAPDGSGWSDPLPCGEDEVCLEGVCIGMECDPGEQLCAGNNALVCNDEGTDWDVEDCGDGVCLDGECIECVKDEDCPDGLECDEGICQALALTILTNSLPDGKVDETYEASLEVEGGVGPYMWALVDGALPAGLSINSEFSVIEGTPTEAGDFEVTLEVTDTEQTTVDKTFFFTIYPQEVEIIIVTGSPLPTGEEGTSYSVQLQASGGAAPYTWGIVEGELPQGLSLSSSGIIAGTPEDHGTFTFKVKVFDNSEPVGVGSKTFDLSMEIAPLEIIGGTEYDLWVTKIIILKLLTAVEGIPLPYNEELQAKGGVKPYHWTEEPLPGFVDFIIPESGIPEGLTLDEDGSLHGSVTDPDQAISVNIPFVGIDLSGFFFTARVEDSQDPADSATAIYLIPTVPVAF